MDYHIREIILNEKFAKYTIRKEVEKESKTISNLSKLNIFVGANNSGKSRFLRQMASTPKISFVPNIGDTNGQFNWKRITDLRRAFESQIGNMFSADNIADADNILERLSKIPKLDFLVEDSVALDALSQYLNTILSINRISSIGFKSYARHTDNESLLRGIKAVAKTHLEQLNLLNSNIAPKYSFYKLYIPTLRGLRDIYDGKDCYEKRTMDDYFTPSDDSNKCPDIFTGLKLYDEVKRLLLGNLDDRLIISQFQEFLANKFFEGKQIALIPKLDKKVLDIKIGDEVELPIHNLGDGIQSIIILTFPLFKHRGKKLLVFFEEPELYMHPGLQRVFLSVLSGFDDYQYFLTTHSNHFLDITLDYRNISVFTFHKELEASDKREKEAIFNVENVSNEDTHMLELLGVRNSSVFLSNCTVWVEGMTDRRYLTHYLTLYQNHLETDAKKSNASFRRFKEDLHFSFVEYPGGGNITHWSFLDNETDSIMVERLCGKLFLITDKDKAESGAKKKRHQNLREKLADRYYCLQCREIENLLTPNVIKEIVKEYEGGDIQMPNLLQDSYKDNGLGEFIEKDLLQNARKRKGAYATESGTVSDKVNFCQKAIEHIKSFEDLSPEAQDLTKRIYNFIKAHNL